MLGALQSTPPSAPHRRLRSQKPKPSAARLRARTVKRLHGAVRVVAYVVSGIGFLGAGVIMKEGVQVRGLNTAATLWTSAAVGSFAGAGERAEAALVAIFVLAGNTLLRPLVDFVNRRPVTADQTEALYRVHVVCRPGMVSSARGLHFDELERHHYPIGEIETLSESEDLVELAAVFLPTPAEAEELDLVVSYLEHSADVISTTWTVSTTNLESDSYWRRCRVWCCEPAGQYESDSKVPL